MVYPTDALSAAMTQQQSPLLQPPLLLATDGSASAQIAQNLVLPIAQYLAVQSQSGSVAAVKPNLVALHVQAKAAAADAELPPALTALQTAVSQIPASERPEIALQTAQGRTATEILNLARSQQAGLIALGCHGTAGARELLVGSVSVEIARYAESHVLIARSLPDEEPPAAHWQHVLLVVTGAQSTQSAIALTRQLIPVGIRQLTILCVQPPLTTHYLFGPFATPTPSWQLIQSLQQVQQEQSQQIIQQAESAFEGLDLQIETLVQIGEPGAMICQVAQQRRANVMVLGSDAIAAKRTPEKNSLINPPRRLSLRSLRLNATADYAIHHAPCPVLLCRIKPFGPTDSNAPAESSPG